MPGGLHDEDWGSEDSRSASSNDGKSFHSDEEGAEAEGGAADRASAVEEETSFFQNLWSRDMEHLLDHDEVLYFTWAVIGVNVTVFAWETDNSHNTLLNVIEATCLCFYTLELVAIFATRGFVKFFVGSNNIWNFLDALLVVVGWLELWLIPLWIQTIKAQDPDDPRVASLSHTERLLQLVRVCRVLKVGRGARGLKDILSQVIGPFGLVITLLYGCNFLLAIVFTHVIGNGEGLSDETRDSQLYLSQVQPFFCDWQTSFFTFFQITTTDNWGKIASPMISLDRRWMIFWWFFIAFASWTMISILTAVASDRVISAANKRMEQWKLLQEKNTRDFLSFLERTFKEGDADGSGTLDKEEFQEILNTPAFEEKLIQMNVKMSKEEILGKWDSIDVYGNGQLEADEFVRSLRMFAEDNLATTKRAVEILCSLKRMAVQASAGITDLRGRIKTASEKNETLINAVKQQTELYRQQVKMLDIWADWATENGHADVFTAPDNEVGGRISERPDEGGGGVAHRWSQQTADSDAK